MTKPGSTTDLPNRQNRAYALDALRGFAILAMLLSGQLPFDGRALPGDGEYEPGRHGKCRPGQ
jgi:hypothetical protein